jgi:hypothetical protein
MEDTVEHNVADTVRSAHTCTCIQTPQHLSAAAVVVTLCRCLCLVRLAIACDARPILVS